MDTFAGSSIQFVGFEDDLILFTDIKFGVGNTFGPSLKLLQMLCSKPSTDSGLKIFEVVKICTHRTIFAYTKAIFLASKHVQQAGSGIRCVENIIC
jgi:hypothetical protein